MEFEWEELELALDEDGAASAELAPGRLRGGNVSVSGHRPVIVEIVDAGDGSPLWSVTVEPNTLAVIPVGIDRFPLTKSARFQARGTPGETVTILVGHQQQG